MSNVFYFLFQYVLFLDERPCIKNIITKMVYILRFIESYIKRKVAVGLYV